MVSGRPSIGFIVGEVGEEEVSMVCGVWGFSKMTSREAIQKFDEFVPGFKSTPGYVPGISRI